MSASLDRRPLVVSLVLLSLLWFAVPSMAVSLAGPAAQRLTVDRRVAPLAVDVSDVTFDWLPALSPTAARGDGQGAWRVQVAASPQELLVSGGSVWDSGRRAGPVPFDHAPPRGVLRPDRAYSWRVQLWDSAGVAGPWSPPARFATAPSAQQWAGDAVWVGGATSPSTRDPLLRAEFDVAKVVASARWSLAALGYGVPSLDGAPVTQDVLAPSFTDYTKRVEFVTYDVTARLTPGRHALGVALGRGWYGLSVPDTWGFEQARWHAEPELRSRLSVTYTDGTTQVFGSRPRVWNWAPGPTVRDAVYNGETVDARLVPPGWDSVGGGAGFTAAKAASAPAGRLVPRIVPPVRVTERAAALGVSALPDGSYVYDFGRQRAGWAELSSVGMPGQTVSLTYGERLRSDGSVDNDNVLVDGVPQRDTFTFAGTGQPERFAPQFTYKGYRYVQVRGVGLLPAGALSAVRVQTALEPTGAASADESLNSLSAMVDRTLANNMLGHPTDSPMYEKNGWLGDLTPLAPAFAARWDVVPFLRQWADVMRDAQAPSGLIPVVAPNNGRWGYLDAIEWGSAYVDTVWNLYARGGDRRTLVRHYASMAAYGRYLLANRQANGLKDSFFGDWSNPEGIRPVEGAQLTATAYLWDTLQMLGSSAAILGRVAEAAAWRGSAEQVRAALLNRFYDSATATFRSNITTRADGRPVGYRQTSNAVPLAMGLVPADQVSRVSANLVADIKRRGGHLDTGIVGSRYLYRALTQQAADPELAHRVIENPTYPGPGYLRSQGLTELSEDWQPSQSRSLDHYMHGSYATWLHEDLAGLRQTSAGWSSFVAEPQFLDSLPGATSRTTTPYGAASSTWLRANGLVTVLVQVPAGVQGHLLVRVKAGTRILESGLPVGTAPGVTQVSATPAPGGYERRLLRFGSGTYRFVLAG